MTRVFTLRGATVEGVSVFRKNVGRTAWKPAPERMRTVLVDTAARGCPPLKSICVCPTISIVEKPRQEERSVITVMGEIPVRV